MTKQLHFRELCASATKKRLADELEIKVERWIRVAKLCFLVIFDRERQICGKIFSGFGSGVGEEYFLEIVRDSANNLLDFVEAVSNTTQPWERIGTILGLCDTFLLLLPHINSLLNSDSAANATVSRLEDHIRRMLSDFEKAILHELLPVLDDRGAIHSLTVKVMDYIDLMVSHKKMLTGLIKSMPPLKFRDVVIPVGKLGDLKRRSHLALHLILIIVVLQLNLKGKSKQYKQVPLGHLFVMNNVGYIIRKIEGSQELLDIIGDDYMRKLNLNVKEAMTSYQVSTCDELLYCFQDKGLHVIGCFSSVVLKREVRKRLKSFDSQFKEVQECHSNWIVHDSRLRDELRVSVVDKLIPAYKQFLYEFGSYVGVERQNVKCLVEDLQVLLSKNLFSCNEVIV